MVCTSAAGYDSNFFSPYLCVPNDSQNNEPLFSKTAVTDSSSYGRVLYSL